MVSWRKITMAAGIMCIVLSNFPLAAQESSELPDLKETGVVVPWADFKLILEEIRRSDEPTSPPMPPVAFAYSGCQVRATTDDDQKRLRLQMSFDVQVLEPEKWVQVPVAADGMAVSSVTLDGSAARLFRSGGYLNLALRGAGRHRLTADLLVPVSDSRGHKTARLRFPQVPSVTVDMELPQADLQVQVDGAVVQELDAPAGSTRVRAALQQVRDTTVTWFRKVETDEKSAKAFAEVATLLSVGEGVLRGSTTVTFTIHGRGLDTFTLAVPEDLTVLDVSAHGITSWEVREPATEGLPASLVEVRLSFRAQGRYAFQLSFEKVLGAASAEVVLPDIEVLDVLRERGFVAVAAATNVEISPQGELENAAPVDPAELPPELLGLAGETVLYAFKYLRHPVVVPMSVVKHDDVSVKRTIVELARLHTFVSAEGRKITSARYQVKNNRKQYLAVVLPDGASLWGAYRDGRPVKAAQRADGVLLVPLKKTAADASGQLRAFSVEVVYFEAGRRISALGSQRFEAPQLDVDIMEARWRLFLPRDKRYFGLSGNLEEDLGANRIAFIGDLSYNLENRNELAKLGVLHRDGRAVITDGSNEVTADKVTVSSAGEDRPLAADELSRIVGGKGDAAEGEGLELEDAELALEMDEDASAARRPQTQGLWTQVPEASNVALGDLQMASGAQAHGVLPVHFTLPEEGLRLSYVGRLVTADDRANLRLRFVPASWRLPELGAFSVVFITFVAVLILGLAANRAGSGMTRAGWAGLVVAAAVCVIVFLLSDGHRLAFGLAAAAALGCCILVWYLRDRPGTTEGF